MKNYFKKFSIIFVMLLAVIGIGMFQNGNVANAATIGQQLTSPESGWKRYDDNDSNIVYDGKWESNGSVHYLRNDNSGSAKFKFYGTKFRVIAPYDQNGSSNIAIKIDGKDSGTYSSYAKGVSAGDCLVCDKFGLILGYHTVELKNNSTSTVNGYNDLVLNAIDIDSDGKLIPYDESISLDKVSVNVNVGDPQQLTATTTPAGAQVTWKSSDESIATVDSTGKVTALKEGQAVITATTADGLTATCAVTVTPKTAEPTNPDPSDSENIVNIAHAKGDNTNNAGGDVTIIFHGAADTTLSVIKTADVKEVWVGDNFTYTIVVTNTGTKTAKAVVVNDPAPNHINFVVNGITTTQGTVDPSSTSKNIIVNVGDIAPGSTVTIKIPATVVM